MKTISLKLPDSLHTRLQKAATIRGQSKSNVVRSALEKFLNGEPAARPGSALELAGPLVGAAEGPRDLSTNPK
jgi:predicted transcriptional regulator